MKRATRVVYSLIVVILACCLFTGFQCGSTEMTSAKLYIQNGDWANAEKSLSREVDKNPKNGEAWYLLGRARYELKNFRGMLAALDEAGKLSNEHEADIKLIKVNAWASAFNQGVAYHNKATSANVPPDTTALYTRKAIDMYDVAIQINPDSASTYQNVAAIHHTEGNYDLEIENLTKALERKPDPEISNYLINAYVKRAEAAKEKGNTALMEESYNKAIEALQRARKLDPENAELLSSMINLYIETNRASEALPYIREAVEKNPSDKINQNNLGLLLLQTEKFEESIEHFEAAIAVDSLYDQALRNGSVAYMKLGDRMKQESEKKTDAKGKNPMDKSYQEKFKRAAHFLERLTRTVTNDPNIYDALATAYGNAGMFKEAKTALDKADALRK